MPAKKVKPTIDYVERERVRASNRMVRFANQTKTYDWMDATDASTYHKRPLASNGNKENAATSSAGQPRAKRLKTAQGASTDIAVAADNNDDDIDEDELEAMYHAAIPAAPDAGQTSAAPVDDESDIDEDELEALYHAAPSAPEADQTSASPVQEDESDMDDDELEALFSAAEPAPLEGHRAWTAPVDEESDMSDDELEALLSAAKPAAVESNQAAKTPVAEESEMDDAGFDAMFNIAEHAALEGSQSTTAPVAEENNGLNDGQVMAILIAANAAHPDELQASSSAAVQDADLDSLFGGDDDDQTTSPPLGLTLPSTISAPAQSMGLTLPTATAATSQPGMSLPTKSTARPQACAVPHGLSLPSTSSVPSQQGLSMPARGIAPSQPMGLTPPVPTDARPQPTGLSLPTTSSAPASHPRQLLPMPTPSTAAPPDPAFTPLFPAAAPQATTSHPLGLPASIGIPAPPKRRGPKPGSKRKPRPPPSAAPAPTTMATPAPFNGLVNGPDQERWRWIRPRLAGMPSAIQAPAQVVATAPIPSENTPRFAYDPETATWTNRPIARPARQDQVPFVAPQSQLPAPAPESQLPAPAPESEPRLGHCTIPGCQACPGTGPSAQEQVGSNEAPVGSFGDPSAPGQSAHNAITLDDGEWEVDQENGAVDQAGQPYGTAPPAPLAPAASPAPAPAPPLVHSWTEFFAASEPRRQ